MRALDHPYLLKMPEGMWQELRQEADRQDTTVSEMMRRWINERLRELPAVEEPKKTRRTVKRSTIARGTGR